MVDSRPLGFEQDIRPMFRQKDRDAMRAAFDLWAYEDVAAHGEAIAQRVKNGTMPCDGRWSDSQVAVFQQWLGEGAPR
jgi:hypothetical protein